MSKEEWQHWKEEIVPIDIDCVVGIRGKAIEIMVEGENFHVGQSIVDNLEDLLEQLDEGEQDEDLVICVPRWCAQNNGWVDEEP